MIKSILNGCLLFKNTNPVRNMNNNEVIVCFFIKLSFIFDLNSFLD